MALDRDVLIVPPVVLDEHDDEALGDQANDAAGHVDHRDRVERHLAYLMETLHGADRLNDFHLGAFGVLHVKQLLHTDVLIHFWHVVSQERHLLSTDGVVVETPVAGARHREGDSDGEQRGQEVVDGLRRLEHDYG